LRLNARLADAYASRGISWLALGKLAEAESDFTRCRELGGSLKPEAERLWREAKQARKSSMN
jgi:hypothetical protein